VSRTAVIKLAKVYSRLRVIRIFSSLLGVIVRLYTSAVLGASDGVVTLVSHWHLGMTTLVVVEQPSSASCAFSARGEIIYGHESNLIRLCFYFYSPQNLFNVQNNLL
jgi:hypothetical protein